MGAQKESLEDRLVEMGFREPVDFLLTVPKSYHAPMITVAAASVDSVQYLVLHEPRYELYTDDHRRCDWSGKVSKVKIFASDANGVPVRLEDFHQAARWKPITGAKQLHVIGKLRYKNRILYLTSPRPVPRAQHGRIVAAYPGRVGQVKSDVIGERVHAVLDRLDDGAVRLLERAALDIDAFGEGHAFRTPAEFLRVLHLPTTMPEAELAAEFARKIAAQSVLAKAVRAHQPPGPVPESRIPISKDTLTELASLLPYPLTVCQVEAIKRIALDLRSDRPMRRLLSGDVGTGKSIAFLIPAAAAYLAGANVAILAPSTLVVAQLADNIRTFFKSKVPVHVVVSGSEPPAAGIWVGTMALANYAKKTGTQFGFVITDEQQKFGSAQRSELVRTSTNFLEATATAIPRTQALVVYGGLAQSTLTTQPVRKVVKTHITSQESASDMARLEKYFLGVLNAGGQVAVIYPQVGNDNDTRDLAKLERDDEAYRTVQAAASRWEAYLPGRVGYLHGQMSTEEKNAVIERMKRREVYLLISTTVLEVGVTLPSLRALLVTHPERYGIGQLHQLRGRLAREGGFGRMMIHLEKSVAATEAEDPELMERLRVLVECSDGFAIAERDMAIRGFGDVQKAASLQSGKLEPLFWGLGVTFDDLNEAAKRREAAVAARPSPISPSAADQASR